MSKQIAGASLLKANLGDFLQAAVDARVVPHIPASLEFLVRSRDAPPEAASLVFEHFGTPSEGHTVATDTEGNRLVILYVLKPAEGLLLVDSSVVVPADDQRSVADLVEMVAAVRAAAQASGELAQASRDASRTGMGRVSIATDKRHAH